MAKKKINYQELKQELDSIVNDLQVGDIDIDEAIKKYEQGQEIARQLEEYIAVTKKDIVKIDETIDPSEGES